jgi:hypothetical protein
MGTDDLRSRWTIRGDPALLAEAATALRGTRPEQIFGARFPGEYVMSGIARLLEALADEMHVDNSALTREVVSAAADISGHVLKYLPEIRATTMSRQRTDTGSDASRRSPDDSN